MPASAVLRELSLEICNMSLGSQNRALEHMSICSRPIANTRWQSTKHKILIEDSDPRRSTERENTKTK